jgi:hypothetical protein
MNDIASQGPLHFDSDIKPLFRNHDRDSMSGHFDLWSSSDVLAHGDAIVSQLREGTMPCDGEWPDDQIKLLERWLAQGGDE